MVRDAAAFQRPRLVADLVEVVAALAVLLVPVAGVAGVPVTVKSKVSVVTLLI